MQTRTDFPKIDWHVPRTAEADGLLSALMGGPVRAFRIFGERQTGKTSFLLSDVAVLAARRGHRVIYADFWRGEARDPAALLLWEIRQSNDPGYLASWIERLRVVELTGLGIGGKLEVAAAGAEPADLIDSLSAELHAVANPDKPTLLLLDEFQRVALAANGTAFIAALRAILNRHRTGLRAVFTGSSQAALHRLFSETDAPFFHYADRFDLEPLGDDFVKTQLNRFRQARQGLISLDDAKATFAHFGGSPMWFNRWITKLFVYPSMSAEQAREAILLDVARDHEFDRLIADLSPPRRAMLWLLAEGEHGLSGRPAIARAAEIGLENPTKSRLNAALQALSKKGLAEQQPDASWALSDTLLADWLLRLGADRVMSA